MFMLIILLLAGCSPETELPTRTVYSFFVAGHTYGKPGVNNVGLHPPFVDQFELINDDPQMEFGVLTGDFVKDGAIAEFQEVTDQLNEKLDVPVHYAPGNHDLGDLSAYLSYYGSTFSAFEFENDLFILLDPTSSNWSITGKQLGFLNQTLEAHRNSVNHIFVCFHQLLWWEEGTLFEDYPPNSLAGRSGSVNFYTEVLPLLQGSPIPVVCFAGDIGAHWNQPGCMYYESGNTTFVASGMGGETQDNFVIVSVMGDGSLDYQLVALNCDTGTDCMGALEDYYP